MVCRCIGFLKSFTILPDELEDAFEEGTGFDRSFIGGFARIEESNMATKPDPDNFVMLPWRAMQNMNGAWMFCYILKFDGNPYKRYPRYSLKRNLKKAADIGFTSYVRHWVIISLKSFC
jgi:glutamine synthetase